MLPARNICGAISTFLFIYFVVVGEYILLLWVGIFCCCVVGLWLFPSCLASPILVFFTCAFIDLSGLSTP